MQARNFNNIYNEVQIIKIIFSFALSKYFRKVYKFFICMPAQNFDQFSFKNFFFFKIILILPWI